MELLQLGLRITVHILAWLATNKGNNFDNFQGNFEIIATQVSKLFLISRVFNAFSIGFNGLQGTLGI